MSSTRVRSRRAKRTGEALLSTDYISIARLDCRDIADDTEDAARRAMDKVRSINPGIQHTRTPR
jgi:hypothetical protein